MRFTKNFAVLVAGTLAAAPWCMSTAGEFEAAPTTVRDVAPNTDSGIISKANGLEILIYSENGGAEVPYAIRFPRSLLTRAAE